MTSPPGAAPVPAADRPSVAGAGVLYVCFPGTMSTFKSAPSAVRDERGASVVPALIALGLDADFIAAYYGVTHADAERIVAPATEGRAA